MKKILTSALALGAMTFVGGKIKFPFGKIKLP